MSQLSSQVLLVCTRLTPAVRGMWYSRLAGWFKEWSTQIYLCWISHAKGCVIFVCIFRKSKTYKNSCLSFQECAGIIVRVKSGVPSSVVRIVNVIAISNSSLTDDFDRDCSVYSTLQITNSSRVYKNIYESLASDEMCLAG